MDKRIVKNLLIGMLPLFVFILADEIWGTVTGLYVALGFGLVQLVVSYLKTKRIDKFVLVDTALLCLFGLVSIALHNDVFFKLKPALIELIMAVIIGVSAFSSKNILLNMSQHYLKDIQLTSEALVKLKRNMSVLFFITLAHIVLLVYSAYFMSNEAWAFISGGLFYLIFIAYFGIEFLLQKVKMVRLKKEEWLPVVDESGVVIGRQTRTNCHFQSQKPLHPVVHLHLFNEQGELFLQKRAMSKEIQPGKWDTSVGGHIAFNERLEDALLRESKEEIGIQPKQVMLLQKYIWETNVERELVYSFSAISSELPVIDQEELEEGKFWKIKDIEKQFEHGLFTENFKKEFEFIKQNLPKIVSKSWIQNQ